MWQGWADLKTSEQGKEAASHFESLHLFDEELFLLWLAGFKKYIYTKNCFAGRGRQECSRLQPSEAEASESREVIRDEKRLSHQDSLQLKPLFRNRDCAHETQQQQLLPLVFRRETVVFSWCLCFGCWCAGAAGPFHLQGGVALDCARA